AENPSFSRLGGPNQGTFSAFFVVAGGQDVDRGEVAIELPATFIDEVNPVETSRDRMRRRSLEDQTEWSEAEPGSSINPRKTEPPCQLVRRLPAVQGEMNHYRPATSFQEGIELPRRLL